MAYIALRSELHRAWRSLERAIAEAHQEGWLGTDIRGSGYGLEVYLHPGGGAYISGEETALLESLEGRRAEPRAATGDPPPPLLYARAAAVQGAGTLAYLPAILDEGPSSFRRLGTDAYPGTCVFCVSGHVRRPGLYELELGAATLGQIIEECAGGVPAGRQLKAVLPSGYGAPPLPPDQVDVDMTPEAWAIPAGGPFPGAFANGGIITITLPSGRIIL